MKVIIFEVCRSPEIKKETEALVISKLFEEEAIDYEIYSNDCIWSKRTTIDRDFIKQCLIECNASIVHMAMHGDENGLVLKWSTEQSIENRFPEDILTSFDIKTMSEWSGKLLVSGACSSAQLAKFFLDAGATGVVAPETPISWLKLGIFFRIFYKSLFSGHNPKSALNLAITQFPEFISYRFYDKS